MVSYNTSVQNDISAVMKRRQQNQKISFHFLSGSPHTPRRKSKKGRKIFGFVPRPKGADEARVSPFAQNEFAQKLIHHRRKKLPVPKAEMRPAPKARGWAKGGVASRRIGTEWAERNGRICPCFNLKAI